MSHVMTRWAGRFSPPRKHFAVLALLAVILAATCGDAMAVPIKFVVNNRDGDNEGFNDPKLGATRLKAFQFAADLWSNYLAASYDGETITIDAKMDPLEANTAGSSRSEGNFDGFGSNNPKYKNGIVYGSALANHLKGADLRPNESEMRVTLNSDIAWYYGTDGKPAKDTIDFVSVALHEITHGLNFETRAYFLSPPDTGAGFVGNKPGAYDQFLVQTIKNKDKHLKDMNLIEIMGALTSGEVFWDGADGKAANGGNRPKVFAPEIWKAGSSIAHLDPTTHPTDLMTPSGTAVIHAPSAIDLGMLSDMGWTVVPEPSPLVLLGLGILCLFLYGWRRWKILSDHSSKSSSRVTNG
jgi:hypothetical protein